MKNLLISSIAVLAMASASISLAQGYDSSSNATNASSMSNMNGGGMQASGTKKMDTTGTHQMTKVMVTGSGASKSMNGAPKAKATDVTVSGSPIEGRSFVLKKNETTVSLNNKECKSNAKSFLASKDSKHVSEAVVHVESNGNCMVTFK